MSYLLYNHKNGKNLEDQLRAFARGASANCHATIIEKDGAPQLLKKMYRPCYGESRAYGVNSTRPQDDKPGDLPSPLPHSLPRLAYAAGLNRVSGDKEKHNEFITWLYKGEDSFFRNVGKFLDFELSKDGFITGVVALDTRFDPTPLITSLIYIRSTSLGHASYATGRHFEEFFKDHGIVLSRLEKSLLENMITFPSPGYVIDEEQQAIFNKQAEDRFKKPLAEIPEWQIMKAFKRDPNNLHKYLLKPFENFAFIALDRYHFTNNPDFTRIKNAEPRDLSSGKTFLEAEDYNRPDVPTLFKDMETNHKEEIIKRYGLEVNKQTNYSPLEGLPKVVEYVREKLAA